MNNWFKKVLKMSFVVMFVFGGVTGCASNNEVGAKNAVDGLMGNFMNAVQNKDEQALRDCLVSSTSDESIQDQLQQDVSLFVSYENQDAFYLGQVNDRYYFSKLYYAVSNAYTRDYDSSYYSVYCAVEKENGVWKLNMFDEELDKELKSIYLSDGYYSLAGQARDAGRNCMLSTCSFAKNECDFIIEGSLMCEVVAAWQNEDGSVTTGFILSNGMDEAMTFDNMSFTITDSVYGEILNGSIPNSYILEAGQSMYIEYTYEADSITSGMQTWNDIQFHTNFNFD